MAKRRRSASAAREESRVLRGLLIAALFLLVLSLPLVYFLT
jgi:hypothetical protein